MSQIHKVILLNKPLKIFDFTPFQLILMFFSIVLAFVVGSNIPQNMKVGNLPAGFLAGMLILCGSIVVVKMSEVKPWAWWRNLILYRLNMVPTVFLPRPEPGQLYPDPTIIDVKKRSEEYYVESDSE